MLWCFTALPIKKRAADVALYAKYNLQFQTVLLPPTAPSSLYVSLIVSEPLFNTKPSIIALVKRSPNIPPPPRQHMYTRYHPLPSA